MLRPKLKPALFCAFLFTALAVQAQQPEALGLPEEKKLKNLTQVEHQEFVIQIEGMEDELGWTSLEVLSAELDSQPVYLARRVGEAANLNRGRVQEVLETALYNQDLELIVAHFASRLHATGDESKQIEYRWEDGELWSKQGKAKKKKLDNAGRPVADFDLQVALRGMKNLAEGESVELITLDTEASEIKTETMTRGERSKIKVEEEEVEVTRFESTHLGGSHAYIDDAGELQLMEIERLKLRILPNPYELATTRKLVAGNPQLLEAALGRCRPAWEEKRGRWTNDDLGLDFKPPKKGWDRTKQMGDTQVFELLHETGDAVLAISVEPVGSCYDLPEYAKTVAELLSEVPGISGMKISKDKLGKRPAQRLDYSTTVDSLEMESQLWICIEHGMGIQVTTISTPDASNRMNKDLQAMLSSLRFAK